MSLGRWFPPLGRAGLASAVTSVGVAAAVTAMAVAPLGHARLALSLLAVALAADRFDGPIARARGESSPFGVEIDSLADQVAFVVTPAVLALTSHALGLTFLPLLLLYVLAGTWRLAHFNVAGLRHDASGDWFQGQPTTDTAAWFLVLSVLARHLAPTAATVLLAVVFAAGSVLMLSALRYPKNGLPQRILLLLVPLALIALWLA